MSEQRKRRRWTDAEIQSGWEQDAHVRSMAMQHVRDDHLQAREDRKRLVVALRDMAPFRWRGTGAYCWCPEARGSACFNRKGEATGRGCVAKNALLAEADPQ